MIKKKTSSNLEATIGSPRYPLLSHNGNASALSLDRSSTRPDGENNVIGIGMLSPHYAADNHADSLGQVDKMGDVYGNQHNRTTGQSNKRAQDSHEESSESEDSKWIHRDKLAKIESEELQAAGIVLPQSRSRSRPRRDRSQSSTKRLTQDTTARPRKNSLAGLEPKTPDLANVVPNWDLRLPDEVESQADPHFSKSAGGLTAGSRIPVAKTSPAPIPAEHLERDTPMVRKRENSPGEDEKQIAMPKTRSRANSLTMKSLVLEPSPNLMPQPAKRSATDASPNKSTTAGARKSSAPAKTNTPSTRGGRGRGRGGGNNNSRGGGSTRPTTRSGERELGATGTKRPEGDPPWLVNSYKPDPRLPPDQQLLPTVARRLQQEKWEREGKFGNIYDREFRPLTDEGYSDPPPAGSSSSIVEQEVEKAAEWPLKPDAPKSPVSPGRTNSYSTMPKIQDPPTVSPLASPRTPVQPVFSAPAPQPKPTTVTRLPDMPEKQDVKKEGCGCCIVM